MWQAFYLNRHWAWPAIIALWWFLRTQHNTSNDAVGAAFVHCLILLGKFCIRSFPEPCKIHYCWPLILDSCRRARILTSRAERKRKEPGISSLMINSMLCIKTPIRLMVTAGLLFGVLSISSAFASTEKVLWSFGGNGDGSTPTGNLIVDAAGNLYGVTILGGTNNTGTVFELSPDGKGGWTESVLYSFGPQGSGDGDQPQASLVMDKSGNLYGTTISGGSNDFGTVFRLSPKAGGGWTETILYDFAPTGDGRYPTTDLVLDANGNLYGTTGSGGTKFGALSFS